MDSNESFTAIQFLNNIIIKVVNTSRKNEKRTEEIRIYHLLNNNLVKQQIARIKKIKINNHITKKLTNGKNCYFVINNELTEPKGNTGNQMSTDTEALTLKKDSIPNYRCN